MADTVVVLRNKSAKGRKSLYSRYVKENIFNFGKTKDNAFDKNQFTKRVRPHVNLYDITKKTDKEGDDTKMKCVENYKVNYSKSNNNNKPNDNNNIESNNNNSNYNINNNSNHSTAARPPPAPTPRTSRRPPCSATAIQSRTTNDLDSALKEFKLSTAASRESLKSSRLDLTQMEESVKTMMRSRPSTPLPERWRNRMMTL